jgi:NADH pyrophosphatase NudC (nudix superfamily)
MTNSKKFDLDKFINHLEMDEELAMAELSNRQRDRKQTYRKCPRCGTRNWQQLYVDERGRSIACDKCDNRDQ